MIQIKNILHTILFNKLTSCVIPVFLIIALAYFPIFSNLGKFQIRMWDEATYANNAIDMFTNGNYLVVEQLGETDFYNTKPPLVLWFQVICMKIYGVNELAVRLPSAIFGMMTVLLVFFFCKNVLASSLTGIMAAIILLTTKGYISNHVVRTGDLDSALVFWLTFGLLLFVKMSLQKHEKKSFSFILLTISIAAGFLTKGIAGFFFIPVMLFISIFHYQDIFKDKRLYISIIAIALVCSGYYLFREYNSPGYLAVIWKSEILRYGKNVMSWQVQPFDYYFQNLLRNRFFPFIYFLPLVALNFFISNKEKKFIISCLSISAASYFLIISFPSVKLEWYDAPIFPLLAILTGLSFMETVKYLTGKLSKNANNNQFEYLLFILALLLLGQPYKDILKATEFPEQHIYPLELEGAYLKHLQLTKPDIKELTVFKKEKNPELYDQVLFYKRAFEIENKMQISITNNLHFSKNTNVMAFKGEDKAMIEKIYLTKVLNNWNGGVVYNIVGEKQLELYY